MHLYTFSAAPNPQRLNYFMQYKGIDIDTTEINIKEGEQFSEKFVAINPASTLPALVLDDGKVLTDTIAICVYLEKRFPDKPLFGMNDAEYAQVIGWDHRIYVDGLAAVAEILRNQSEFFKDRALPGGIKIPQLDVLIERGITRTTAFWMALDQSLTDQDYLVGNQLSLADIDAFVVCGFAGWVKQSPPEHCKSILRWQKNIAAQLETTE